MMKLHKQSDEGYFVVFVYLVFVGGGGGEGGWWWRRWWWRWRWCVCVGVWGDFFFFFFFTAVSYVTISGCSSYPHYLAAAKNFLIWATRPRRHSSLQTRRQSTRTTRFVWSSFVGHVSLLNIMTCKPWEIVYNLWGSLGLSDAIWRQRSGSPLAQVMACCQTAPSHYLNQCWLIISKV